MTKVKFLDDVIEVFELFRMADPKVSDVTVAGWLSSKNEGLVVEGVTSDEVEVSPLVWLASGRDKNWVFTLAGQAAFPLSW